MWEADNMPVKLFTLMHTIRDNAKCLVFIMKLNPAPKCYEYNKLLKGDDEHFLLSLFISRTKQRQPEEGGGFSWMEML